MTGRSRKIVAAAVVFIAAAGVVAALGMSLISRPAVYSPTTTLDVAVTLRPWPEHDAIYRATGFPYVVACELERGALLYIGCRHTSDAANPQLTEVERLWDEFKPTVALCEGRQRMFRYTARNRTGGLAESELTRILAWRHGVPLYTLEPTYEAEVAALLKHFEPRLVATYFTLRVFTQEAKREKGDKDALALHLLEKRTNVEGLRGSLRTVADLDAFWTERFPDSPGWRTLPDTEGLPLLREVGDRSRECRGEHMVRSLVELTRKGERVLAVVGASHVIRQEPCLIEALGAPSTAAPPAN